MGAQIWGLKMRGIIRLETILAEGGAMAPHSVPFDIGTIKDIFRRCWCLETSSLWTAENPTRGQCGVTALVVRDYLGGAILKTKGGRSWHFYNQIAGSRYDLTDEQFEVPPVYDDILSTRDEALADTSQSQYEFLARSFDAALSQVAYHNIADGA